MKTETNKKAEYKHHWHLCAASYIQLLNLPCKHTMKQNQRLAMLFLRLPPKPNFLQTRLFKKHSEDQDGTLSKCFVGS